MLIEAYQSNDLHTTFPGNNGFWDWLSNNVVFALKLTRRLNILIVVLFYVCLRSHCFWHGKPSMPSDVFGVGVGEYCVCFLNNKVLNYQFSLEISFSYLHIWAIIREILPIWITIRILSISKGIITFLTIFWPLPSWSI